MDFRRQVPPAVADFVRNFNTSVQVARLPGESRALDARILQGRAGRAAISCAGWRAAALVPLARGLAPRGGPLASAALAPPRAPPPPC